MKACFFLSLGLFLSVENAFPQQCPKPGLIIQSAACDSPRNLRVDTIACSQLTVSWQGVQSQTYVVKTSNAELATGRNSETETTTYAYDKMGRFTAAVPVKEGSKVSWSVQAICTEGGATFHSAKAEGGEVDVPLCGEAAVNTTQTLQAYPNPSSGDVVVVYNGTVTKETLFALYDVAGKRVLGIQGDAVKRTADGYLLNLRHLTNGAYLLQLTNGAYKGSAKVVLLKN